MAATKYDIEIDQGAEWTFGLLVKKANGIPFDFEGYTAQCQIRRTADDSVVLATVLVTFDPVPKTGKLTLYLSEAQTTTLTMSRATYDLKLRDPRGKPKRLLQGDVTINAEVTR